MEKKISYRVQTTDLPCEVRFLLKHRLGLTTAQIKSAKFRPGGICINGCQVRVTDPVQPGAVLEVLLESRETGSHHLAATKGKFDILYEDEDLVIVNKEAGTAIHPGHGHYQDTLANYLMYYFKQQKNCVTVRAIGRLDKDTSGLVVFAKNQVAAARLTEAAKLPEGERTAESPAEKNEGRILDAACGIRKEYVALIQGHLELSEGCIELPIRKAREELNKMETAQTGNFARTWYQVLEVYPESSLIRLRLDTGRTHQIRVHLSAMGHPLLGDALYGKARSGGLWRAALHCERVELRQPFTGEKILVTAPLPKDMAGYLREAQIRMSERRN